MIKLLVSLLLLTTPGFAYDFNLDEYIRHRSVKIFVKGFSPQHGQEVGGQGSGVLLGGGKILTCAHVLGPEGSEIQVLKYLDNDYHKAVIVSSDSKLDIAILRIEEQESPYLVMSQKFFLGDKVVSVGNPVDDDFLIVHSKIMSLGFSKVESESFNGPYIFVDSKDSKITRGFSGGGLFSTQGELIGIVRACRITRCVVIRLKEIKTHLTQKQ